MEQTFLEKESIRSNKRNIKISIASLILCCIFGAFIVALIKDDPTISDYRTRELLLFFGGFFIFLLILTVVIFVKSAKVASHGENLILPFKDTSKDEAAKLIDQQANEGKLLVDEFIDKFKEDEKPYGERVVLTPSYLLLFPGLSGKIIVIPRSKVEWLCAQIGVSGRSSFKVRLLVFTEKKCYALDGYDIDHAKGVAEKLYQYIPNVFSDYDYNFTFSHMLKDYYDKSYREYREFFELAQNGGLMKSLDK